METVSDVTCKPRIVNAGLIPIRIFEAKRNLFIFFVLSRISLVAISVVIG